MKLFNSRIIFICHLFYFSLLNFIYSQQNSESIFKCGFDSIKSEPKYAEYISPISQKFINLKTALNTDNKDEEFKDFNIYLDLYNFNDEIKKYKLEDKKEFFITGMNKAIKTLETLLKVKRTKNYKFTDENLIANLIYSWNDSLIGNKTRDKGIGMIDLGIDLYIFVRFGDSEEIGKNNLASASAKFVDKDTDQPLLGVVNINREVDYSKENSLRFFEGIFLHELIHVLGFSYNKFKKHYRCFQEIDRYGILRTYVNSTKVVEVAKKYFNCSDIKGVELENHGGNETISHWEERILLGEIMSYSYDVEEVISEFTLAVLEDTGYYKANYYTGGLMQFGKNKGCDFLNLKCVNDGKVNPKFKNEFFDYTENYNYNPAGCSSGRQSRAYHFIYNFGNIIPQFQYYNNKNYGGRASADYCPVSQKLSKESENIYYVGHCSEKGSGKYGSRIKYQTSEGIKYYTSEELSEITKEKNSENSFCVLSSLISKNIYNYNDYSNTIRAICYKMYCSDRSLTIQINNDFIVCPRSGGKIKATNYEGYLLCPDYYLICSGTVLCNDMYDCVEKKSLLKNDIIYDYESKTSQDHQDNANSIFIDDGYELTSNGKCPQFCKHCNELGQCLECIDKYEIVEFMEDGLIKRECKYENSKKIKAYNIVVNNKNSRGLSISIIFEIIVFCLTVILFSTVLVLYNKKIILTPQNNNVDNIHNEINPFNNLLIN